jgi:hypothetical protein
MALVAGQQITLLRIEEMSAMSNRFAFTVRTREAR